MVTTTSGQSKTADYKTARRSCLMSWIPSLTSWRNQVVKVMVIVVPEHGAALQGDKMPGLWAA
ncbi:cellulose synthase operon protein YhjU [Kluyvera cryocrescens]|uniref:Cellulose synthase operon protein YhjU n=1 Tax=Kluyvera cryocrescens TaxID=580 RepID=A0A485AMX5_KLUCR|nr:cellulose synthase operon protein YhjU [Kluyvera cryocrescens]